MKKYILLLLAAGIMSSCYDLEQYPHDKLNSGTFWQTEDHAHQAIIGVYAQMRQNDVFGTYFWQDGLGDIAYGMNEGTIEGRYTDREGIVANKWQKTYEGIVRANIVLQNIDRVNMSDGLKTRYKGEARFMRALYYFHLMDFYGGVPLYDETTVVSDEFMNMKKPRSTTEETRKFILDDLQAAIDVLPVKWENENYGRATRGAAVALRGKVKLYAKDYKGAAADFEEIVNDPEGRGYGYALYDSYADLFKPTGHKSSEMIFSIQNLSGIGTEYGMPFGLRLGSRSSYGSSWNTCIPTDILADMYENLDGTAFNWEDYIPGFTTDKAIQKETFLAVLESGVVTKYPEKKELIRQIYAQRDPRMEQSIITPYSQYFGCNGTIPKMMEFVLAPGTNENYGYIRNNRGWYDYLWRKFVPEGDMDGTLSNREHVPINFPLIRYADVLLMLAECYNEDSKQNEAVALINQIRQRPSTHMPALNSGPAHLKATTKEEVHQRLMHERAVELACEGHRFSDLRRWGLCEEMLNFTYDDLLGNDRYKRIFVERDYLWPIPAVEFERNVNLGKNNPGW
ncbi:RagB/SusD family nutrient uptake outer membrane protein [uncultured Bacteroides sp.]|uniref:RagB/SusD family nutrient uptake outer membrane protein n=1 Tax=uncultured Bacteroides sp. TaxID=162156 RepID=UPI0025CD1ABD|nr:RagB/SusD family nutrient uptake outer membrane protein [uncultured Bacteroides sp.]